MPKEIRSREEFEKLLPSATEIRVVRKGDSSKIKLRTKETLYTFQTDESEIESITKGTKTPVVEF